MSFLSGLKNAFTHIFKKREEPLGGVMGDRNYAAKKSFKKRGRHPLRRAHFGTFRAMSLRHRQRPPYSGY